jgi:hypothetical protein
VDAIFDLLNTVIKITLVAGGAFIVFNVMRSKKFNSTKTDLQNLQARLSQLRLALKAKVKRKSNIFRTMIKTAIIEGDLFDTSTRNLIDVKFETSDDFQEYFDVSRQIVSMINVENGTAHEAATENNFMSSDFKTEMDIIRIIKEMVDLSAKINARVEDHNRTSSQKLKKVDPLVFASITEINRVFKADDNTTESKAS